MKKIRIKDEIYIGGHLYRIVENEKECLIFGTETNAVIDYEQQRIYYKKNENMSETFLCQAIAHEILHAFQYESALFKFLKSKDVGSEEIPSFLENIFYQFLMDNTNFFVHDVEPIHLNQCGKD